MVAAGLVGLVLFEVRPSLPRADHVRSLVSYARYSWLGTLSSRTFGWMDTLVLSFFVAPGLIGIYEVSWRLASVLVLVSTSIQHTLFPEISGLSSDGNREEIHFFLNEALFYAGVFTIPGLFGALVLGSKVLRIYGAEFTRGGGILLILIVARMVDAYGSQLLSAINAINRPDVAFRINFVFLISNLVLNIGLISLFGWYGAAVATATSAGSTLILSYLALSRLVDPPGIPAVGIAKQVLAAGTMATVVWALRAALPWQNMYVTVALVFVGAAIYALLLLAIYGRVRAKTRSLLPRGFTGL